MNETNLRKVYGQTLVRLGKEDNRIVVLEADLGKSTMSCFFEQAYPDRFFEMGIAEQNMASFAAGLSLTGKIPFINSFAVFSTGRVYDQIRQSICTGNLNVKINGSSAGLSDFGDGATHQSVDDIVIMRALPNMTVLVPADGVETEKAVEAAVKHRGPVYLRITRNDVMPVTDRNHEFTIGRPCVLKEGKDIVVFACGVMVTEALEAAKQLDKEGISLRVVNVSSLKPVEEEEIQKLARSMKGVITAEEHSVIGGLTSLVTYILRGMPVPVEPVAIMDSFGQSAENHRQLLEAYGLTSFDIIKKAKKLMGTDELRK